MGFANPIEAMNQIVTCLDMPRGTEVHVGSFESGLSIPACRDSNGLLRVETGPTRPATSPVDLNTGVVLTRAGGKCKHLIQEIMVTYTMCFQTNTGRSARRTADLTADGQNVVLSWWEALGKIMCCTPWNQNIRFIRREDKPPDGTAVGWEMVLEVDITFCDACPE